MGTVPLITQSLKRIEGIDEAYWYGSFARNRQDAASDIDVLVGLSGLLLYCSLLS
jgi:predicted nucleotidyltransferase